MAIQPDANLLRDLTRDLLVAGRLWRKMARHAAAKHGVSEAAAAPLVWISRLGENVRQTVLAEAVGIEGASLVRLLDDLSAAGMVRRETDPNDRRANNLHLTPTGETAVAEIEAELQALRAGVFAAVSAEDIAGAGRVIAAIKAAAAGEGIADSPRD
jgi:MarR family transcriptional regulator for hemolysin